MLDIRNAWKKHPERRKDREAEPTANGPLGEPPGYLNEVQRRLWRDVRGELVDGVALASDRRSFEALIRLLELMERNELDTSQFGALLRYFERFGMTPADRSRVSAPKSGDAKNRFGKLG